MSVVTRVDTEEEDVCCIGRGSTDILYSGHQSRVKSWRQVVAPEFLVPSDTIDCGPDQEITSIVEIHESAVIAISFDRTVQFYDMSDLSKPSHTFLNCTKEEINQLTVNKRGEFLSVTDDSGEILIIDIRGRKKFKSCRSHDNICSCAIFNPRRQWEIISGGLDCQLITWDFSKGKLQSSVNMSEVQPFTDPGSAYSVNPPMVHALCMINEGPLLAAGLGNGCIALINSAKRNIMDMVSIVPVHSSSVNTVQYTVLQMSDCKAVSDQACKPDATSEQQILLSGGNDAKIIISTLTTIDPSLAGNNGTKAGARPKLHITGSKTAKVINHGSKINHLCTCKKNSRNFYVADLTNKLTVYDLQ